MRLHVTPCLVLVCQVSALCATGLDSIIFLTQILGDCVSKSGSQWEVFFLVKEAVLERDFYCRLMDATWMAQQTDSAA